MKQIERSGKKKDQFEAKLGKLFDIVNCKCQILLCGDSLDCEGCEAKDHIICGCEDDQKTPEVEILYVLDQRSRKAGSKGKFQMGGKDKKEIERMEELEAEEIELLDKKKKKEEAIEKLK